MNIQNFDKATCRILRAAMDVALKNAGIEGVEFTVGNMSFTNTTASIKVEAKTAGAAEATENTMSVFAKIEGVANTTADGWNLIEYKRANRKYPFIATNPQGKRYKLSPDQARSRFGTA